MKYIFFHTALLLFLSVCSVQANTHARGNRSSDTRILATEHSLIAPEGSRHQWYLNNIAISGATGQELQVTSSGFYKVEYTTLTGAVIEKQTIVGLTAAGAIIRIFTIGDSTVQDYTAGYYPRKGWGQVLNSFFNAANVSVINKAVGGTSSKSFYNSFWPAVRDGLQAGDFVFIQFGINDRNNADPARYTPTGGEFESYLTKYVTETKAKGAFPVLVATLRRNAWNANGTVYDAYHDHPVATRTVAKNLGIPLIDLDAKAKVLLESVGETYATRFLYNNYAAGEYPNYPNGNADNVHFQEMGAIEMAKLVTQGIRDLSTDSNVSKLIPFLKPEYPIGVSVNPVGSDIATTRTTTYPQGLTITLKTIPKTANTFQKWNTASGGQLSTAVLTTVTSGTAATSYTALYAGSTACTASISSSAAIICSGSSVVLTASTGSSYKWFNGTAQVGTAATYTATAAGNYTVEVTTTAGCKATSAIKTITVNPAPVITPYVKIDAGEWAATNTASVCTGSTISFGPHPNLAAGWSWTGPNNFTSTLRNPVLTNIRTANAGTYTATYTDNNGCKATNSFIVTGSAQQTPTISSQSNTICAGSSIVLTASNGSSYNWFKGTLQVGTTSTLAVTEAGSYTVEVTNASGCKATSAATQVTVTPTPIWYADADNDGKGDPFVTVTACTKPSGYVSAAGDGCPADPDKIAAGNCGCGNTETTCLDCAGVVNGMAVLDNCSICVGGTTGKSACVTTDISTYSPFENTLSIRPQPFTETLTISLKNNLIKSVTFFNLQGLLIEYHPGTGTSEIQSGESLPSGLYILVVETEFEVYTSKVIKH